MNLEPNKFKFAYPGSFDPWTRGHLSVLVSFLQKDQDANVDIIIGKNPDKKGMFTLEERKFIIERSIPKKYLNRVRVSIVSGVVADYLYENDIPYFIKGVRDETDFRYENNLASINSQLYGSPMTLFIPQVDSQLGNVSSSNLKMLTNLGIPLNKYANAFTREVLKMRTSGKLMIGVTGGVCVGKSSFCKRLQLYSQHIDAIPKIYHLNLDHIGYSILNEKYKVLPVHHKIRRQIAQEFGEHVLKEDGTIHRKNLGDLVFKKRESITALMDIMLEPMLYLMAKQIEKLTPGIILVESSVLFERNLTELFEENVILLEVNPEIQKQRIMASKGMTLEQAQKRLNSQMPLSKIRRRIARLQEEQYERLHWELTGDLKFGDETDHEIYQRLRTEYYFRLQVRRTQFLFIPEEITFKDDNVFFQDIEKIYNQPNRFYHNLVHIQEVLTYYLELKKIFQHPLEVYCALVFHDILHDPQNSENELASAQFANEYLQKHLQSSNIDISLVVHFIQLTAHHDSNLSNLDYDERLLLDIDMTIFISSKKRLLEYENQIFKEYATIISMKEYRQGRRDFLKRLLNKDFIFRSSYFRSRYEEIAKKKISFLLEFVENHYLERA
ncbi:MAG: dephospho-CoA kinase [Planctomycetes bacterium]|jgi:pantetheine-phosphate adenylyltransferase/dephospho-CoA kinase|nr:dephospho-CoA kinase [Planctomycetota bacterium]HPY74857.1 dephospho-CoA kinase [Planctomycetota bacterium]HQB00883.1 dephospho-CoA kinase [Planctomycetota bacterium]